MRQLFRWIFWPKEMRELVAQYEAEGVLNERAVKHFNRYIRKSILMLYGILLIIYAFVFYKLYFLLVGAVIMLFLIKYDCYRFYKKYISIYQTGTLISAKLKHFYYTKNMNQMFVLGNLSNNQQDTLLVELSSYKLEKHDIPKVGSTISLYYDENHRNGAMLNLDILKKYYSLKLPDIAP